MADKRMFARTIVESDAFKSMSAEAQCLYIHLNMNADDDGFMNNALSVCKSLDYSKNVLDELFDKRFLLDLGDGITVVKGWKVNNLIRKDRYKPTIYQEKMELLKVKNDGSYTWYTNPQPICNQSATQYRIGQDRLDKDREEDIKIKEATMRAIEMGYSSSICDRALTLLETDGYPHTAEFYQAILNTLTNDDIYNKEGYIYTMARNEGKEWMN